MRDQIWVHSGDPGTTQPHAPSSSGLSSVGKRSRSCGLILPESQPGLRGPFSNPGLLGFLSPAQLCGFLPVGDTNDSESEFDTTSRPNVVSQRARVPTMAEAIAGGRRPNLVPSCACSWEFFSGSVCNSKVSITPLGCTRFRELRCSGPTFTRGGGASRVVWVPAGVPVTSSYFRGFPRHSENGL